MIIQAAELVVVAVYHYRSLEKVLDPFVVAI
jgi:hypothetical protein